MNKKLNFPAFFFGLLIFMAFTTNTNKPLLEEPMDIGTYSLSLDGHFSVVDLLSETGI